jgi:seryl-tRNA synthetase
VRGRAEYVAAVDDLLALDEQRRAAHQRGGRLRARRNEVSPQVGRLKQAGRDDEAQPLILEMRELGERMSALEADRTDIELRVRDLLLNIPNLPEPRCPPGGEEANQVVREWGEDADHAFAPRPHWDLGERSASWTCRAARRSPAAASRSTWAGVHGLERA